MATSRNDASRTFTSPSSSKVSRRRDIKLSRLGVSRPLTQSQGDRRHPTLRPATMSGCGRFHVSASEKPRFQVTSRPLNIQQAHRLQNQLMAALEGECDSDEDRKVILGICAMAKKADSKPMNEIIRRLGNFERLQVLVIDEDTILNKPVEDWPVVNGLVSFFSHGFPLEKAIAYKNLRKPFIVNDLEMQYVLQDRRKVYALLEENNIPHPRYAVLDRENDPDCRVSETDDSIEVNGNLFMKPFVEKPVDAENHNIYIYFPVSAGGGSTRLFRKVKDRSSNYTRFCRVRSKGSFLYEDFMPTDGTDVKVYTVGPDYQHAEARKSPALDGKVERDSDGKEIRYPVLLSNREKMIARKICNVFKQDVCGFDLLRANGKIYVCDVNGFSFVKTSSKYYDDCAKILGTLVMRACCPQLQIPYPMCTAPEDIPVVQTTSGSMMELRCVIAVIRHGDRTPKQKMKMEVKNKKFFDLFEKYGGFKKGQLKLKKPNQLQEVLDIVRGLLVDSQDNADPEVEEKKAKLNQLKLVLEMYGHFSGINRKVQLKYQPTGRPKKSSSEDDDAPRTPSLVLILKWGGELTPAGRIQAENLGKAFRTLYPGGQGEHKVQFEAAGLGFLRLHSTFRHDLKIYASDEGRVQMTAAAFTKGLLSLEGELTPIVVQMVKSANTNGLLDGESNTSKYQIYVKEKLKDVFNQDRDFTEADISKLADTNSISVVNAMQFVHNPWSMLQRVNEMIREITARVRCLKMEHKSRDLILFNGESWELLIRRWAKLEKDFRLKNGRFDISKIPDIYDCIKYDLQHNQQTLQYHRAHELFMCSKALADIIIPHEYGITKEERLHIGQSYCTPLLRKIRCDLLQCVSEPSTDNDDSATRLDSKYSNGVASPERFVRTRLYFTSESHIHSLLAMLRYGGFLDEETDEQWKRSMDFIGACAELNYMSQIVIMMFEDPAMAVDSDERFHIELHFSPGAYTSCDEVGAEPKGMGYRPKGSNRDTISECSIPTDCAELSEEVGTPGRCSPNNGEGDLAADKSKTPAEFTKVNGKMSLAPHSPDPETPEWDWGDDDRDEERGRTVFHMSDDDKEAKDEVDIVASKQSSSQQKSSDPCSITVPSGRGSSRNDNVRQLSFPSEKDSDMIDNSKMSFSLPKDVDDLLRRRRNSDTLVEMKDWLPAQSKTEPIEIQVTPVSEFSRDDKRSRSLEDGSSDVPRESAATERNYRTIHLPLSSEVVKKRLLSFPFFQQTPKVLENLEDVEEEDEEKMSRNYFEVKDIISEAFEKELDFGPVEDALEGFHNVPLLHPLETLHNTLTYHQVDDFLGRVTSNKFPVPCAPRTNAAHTVATPIKSPGVPDGASSGNSSGGPSSPVASSVSVDMMKTLTMYIGNQTSGDGESADEPLKADAKP